MKIGCLWLLLYAVAVVPLALFGASMAGEYVYLYRHTHRPYLSNHSYEVLTSEWEAAGALAGAAPGLLLTGRFLLRRHQRKEQEAASAQRASGAEDGTVWPPPPQA